MKRFNSFKRRVVVFSLLLVSVLWTNAALAARKNFDFVNYSGNTIRYLYISSSDDPRWGYDILGSSVLANGYSVGCWYDNRYRYFDVKVIFSSGQEAVFSMHDFRSMWRLTIFRRGSTYYIRNN